MSYTTRLTIGIIRGIYQGRITSSFTRTLIEEVANLHCPNAMLVQAKLGVKSQNNCGDCIVCHCKFVIKGTCHG